MFRQSKIMSVTYVPLRRSVVCRLGVVLHDFRFLVRGLCRNGVAIRCDGFRSMTLPTRPDDKDDDDGGKQRTAIHVTPLYNTITFYYNMYFMSS